MHIYRFLAAGSLEEKVLSQPFSLVHTIVHCYRGCVMECGRGTDTPFLFELQIYNRQVNKGAVASRVLENEGALVVECTP